MGKIKKDIKMNLNEEKEEITEKYKLLGGAKEIFLELNEKRTVGNSEKRDKEIENKINETVLFNYISQMKDVEKRVLTWKLCDEIDKSKSEEMYNEYNITDAVESMKMSLFSKQLKIERKALHRGVSNEGICGAVMKERRNVKDNSTHSKNLLSTSLITGASQPIIKCIRCADMIGQSRSFINICATCSSEAHRIMTNVSAEEDLVCICEPPCWRSLDTDNRCDACLMQGLIGLGLEFGVQYQRFQDSTIEKLRSKELVSRTCELMLQESRRLLCSYNRLAPFTGRCILTESDSSDIRCQWDIRIFRETNECDQCCDICRQRSEKLNSLYIILPSQEHFICYQCIMRAYQVQLRLPESDSCSCYKVLSCNHCLLERCRHLFPLTAIQKRYRIDNDRINCKLCGENDLSIVETLRSGNRLCLICLCRIKINLMSSSQSCSGSCPLDKCSSCLSNLASCVISPQDIVTYRPTLNHHALTTIKFKSSKLESDYVPKVAVTRKKKAVSNDFVDINNTAQGLPLSYTRQKRQVKPTKFQDFLVGKSMSEVFSHKTNSLTYAYEGQSEEVKSEPLYNRNMPTIYNLLDIDEHESEEVKVSKDTLALQICNKAGDNESTDDDYDKVSYNQQESKQIMNGYEGIKDIINVENKINDLCHEHQSPPRHIRIKHAVDMIDVNNIHVIRPGGPRVKQVSRPGINNLDSERKSCIIETTNYEVENVYTSGQSKDDEVVHKDQVNINEIDVNVTSADDNSEMCMLLKNDCGRERIDYVEKFETNVIENNNVTPIPEKVIPPYIINSTNDIDVYRDSDSEDTLSEEENLETSVNNINTVKNETITSTLANDGGYPIVTSRRAMPNKILCYSCGSGGDQMLHCVSCAEPFHFFCIEFQFRPKMKDIFVCRNCTKCDVCNQFGSDLKCIKCQRGYHPCCVDKYPPSHSVDRGKWVCYRCAICIQCGIKAEDVMDQINGDMKQIDWDNDPWQCGRCYRSQKKGHICQECDRAYQDERMTIRCHKCTKSVHIQCIGLTEDECEVLKTMNDKTYECSKCKVVISEDECKRRFSLKRQCKETNLKIYCDKLVTKRVNNYIQRADIKEDQLLKGIEIIGPLIFNQVDGNEDGEDVVLSNNHNVRSVVSSNIMDSDDKDVNSTLYDSSESLGEYDIDQNAAADFNGFQYYNNKIILNRKVRVFCTMKASDYLSPRHMLMDSLAKINIMLHQLYPLIYNDFVEFLERLSNDIFPWIDFQWCLSTVFDIMKRNSSRIRLVLKTITEIIKDCIQKDMTVFSSSLGKVEDKIYRNLMKGREDFIIYYSEHHLSALMKCLETPISANSDNICYKYRMAYSDSENDDIVYEKDIRRCILCGNPGDEGLEGRLIYGSQDVWIHVNCALWSDEVFEKDDGALVNVDKAIKRGLKTICDSCFNYGATVRCSADITIDGISKGCTNCYHFYCAFNSLTGRIFTEMRTFYCTEQHIKTHKEKSLEIADMLTLRRIYIPLNGLSKAVTSQSRMIPAEDIVITIGGLRIDYLGTLKYYSDSFRSYLCPVNYRARRLFWSTKELDSLVMYVMCIQDEHVAHRLSLSPTKISAIIPQKRQKCMETIDYQQTKKRNVSTNKHNIVYEIGDSGNLIKLDKVIKNPLLISEGKQINVFAETQKINRRFPNTAKVQDNVLISHPLETMPINNLYSLPRFNPSNLSSMNSYHGKTSTFPSNTLFKIINQPTVNNTHLVPIHLHNINNQFSNMSPQVVRFNNYNNDTPKIVQLNKPNVNIQRLPINYQPLHIKNVSVHQNYFKGPIIVPNNKIIPRKIIINQFSPQSNHNINQSQSHSPHFRHMKENQVNIKKINSQVLPYSPVSYTDSNINIHNSFNVTSYVSPKINSLPIQKIKIVNSSVTFPRQSTQLSTPQKSICTISSPTVKKENKSSFEWNQFDGSADDNVISEEYINTGLIKSRKYNQEYDHNLKFCIEGFALNKIPKYSWTYLVKKVAQMRDSYGFKKYDLKTMDGLSKFGINHRWVVYIIEQLQGACECLHYEFKYKKATYNKFKEYISKRPLLLDGCRSFPWTNDQPGHIIRDPLAFLHSKSNRAPKNYASEQLDFSEYPEPDDNYIHKLATQFRSLTSGMLARSKNVCVRVSNIHSRGLFARREFQPHDIIIEYLGETIRSILSDVREKNYQKSGVDCYMFRLDRDMIVDATYKGNAARFINHSCEPNCYARVVKFEGDKHIIIIAQRMIYKGEELTYDYRFPLEDDKLACSCGSQRCRKFLN